MPRPPVTGRALALCRPERFNHSPALPEASYIGADHVYALVMTMFDEPLSGWDLHAADAHGQVAGTDELWVSLAEVHTEEGHVSDAMTCLERLERISDRMGSGRTRMRYLLASARILRQDAPGTAQENLRDELFGDTGDALSRFRTRTAMREAGITVPGRKQATTENEELLAILIAEELTNRQIATVLGLSEDVVAGRLFARTGPLSRTEAVTAVLTGHRTRGQGS
ncbi:helix-turn-helix transcriptional regulator [Streptomyces mirabilis]|uniref:helix-turn-helix transcriptional regulator n=1 Tax=Streptomyces mirabilis TaxID=68239 RepID=UPI0036DBD5D2